MRSYALALSFLVSGCSGELTDRAGVTVSLIDNDVWVVAVPDPFAAERGDALPCPKEAHGPDSEMGQTWYTLETRSCGHVTVTQPLRHDVQAGERLDLRQFHMVHTQGDGFRLRLAVGDPPVLLSERTVTGPGATGTLLDTFEAPRAMAKGEPVYWSVTNDGANSWSLIGFTASR